MDQHTQTLVTTRDPGIQSTNEGGNSPSSIRWWIEGYLRRVRVVVVQRGQRRLWSILFYGRVDQLQWDPNRFSWGDNTLLMTYTAALGRLLLRAQHVVPAMVTGKWQGVRPSTYRR